MRALDRGGTVAINAIHLDRIPEFAYDAAVVGAQLAASPTSPARTSPAFLALAAEIPVRTAVEPHPLEDANVALARLAAGEVRGAAVLTAPR